MDLARSAKVMMGVVVVVVLFADIIIPNGDASRERVVKKIAARKQQHSRSVARAIALVPQIQIMLLVAFLRFCDVLKELLFAGKRHVVSCATNAASSTILGVNTIALHDERSLYLYATGIVLYYGTSTSKTHSSGRAHRELMDILRIHREELQETASSFFTRSFKFG
jgi:hypothetical protein